MLLRSQLFENKDKTWRREWIPLHRSDAGDNGDFTKNDPLCEINGLKRIAFVMKNGLVYRRPLMRRPEQ